MSMGVGQSQMVDPNADLTISVGERQSKFDVCSRTVARSCRPWNRMLYGGFKESKPEKGAWTVSFPEDDPKAFEELLRYLHDRSTLLIQEETLNAKDVEALMILTDKYGLQDSVVPQTWAVILNWWEKEVRLAGGIECVDPRMIGLAFHLGQDDDIIEWIHWQIFQTRDSTPFENDQDPDVDAVVDMMDKLFDFSYVLNRIQKIREQKITDMCAVWGRYFNFTHPDLNTRRRPPPGSQPEICRQALRAAIEAQIQLHQIDWDEWFGDVNTRKWESPIECAENLEKIDLTHGQRCGGRHSCNPTKAKNRQIRTILRAPSGDLLSRAQRRQLVRQRKMVMRWENEMKGKNYLRRGGLAIDGDSDV